MKKTMLLTLTFLFTTTSAFAAYFSDVPETNPYYSSIEYLRNNGVINGYSDGTFKPENPVNRAEALKMILASAGVESLDTSEIPNFSDVKPDDWYIKYLITGINTKIVNGNPDGTFAAGKGVNKAELLKMLFISAKVDLSKHAVPSSDLSADVKSGDWFASYFSYAKTVGIIYPTLENKLEPGKSLNRGEVAEIIYRLLLVIKGGDTQKMLSIAESNLVNVLVHLKANDIEKAIESANAGVFYTEQALAIKPDEGIVKAANKIALSFKELCLAYQAGLNGNKELLSQHVISAKNYANDGIFLDKDVKLLAEKIIAEGDNLLNQL